MSNLQRGNFKGQGVLKMRYVVDRSIGGWRVQIAATPAGHKFIAEFGCRAQPRHRPPLGPLDQLDHIDGSAELPGQALPQLLRLLGR
jgi:hypothetical protein